MKLLRSIPENLISRMQRMKKWFRKSTKVRWNMGNSCQTISIGIGVRRPGWKCIKKENGTKIASRSLHRKRSQNNKGEDSWNHLRNWRNCILIIKREWKKFCPDSNWKIGRAHV